MISSVADVFAEVERVVGSGTDAAETVRDEGVDTESRRGSARDTP